MLHIRSGAADRTCAGTVSTMARAAGPVAHLPLTPEASLAALQRHGLRRSFAVCCATAGTKNSSGLSAFTTTLAADRPTGGGPCATCDIATLLAIQRPRAEGAIRVLTTGTRHGTCRDAVAARGATEPPIANLPLTVHGTSACTNTHRRTARITALGPTDQTPTFVAQAAGGIAVSPLSSPPLTPSCAITFLAARRLLTRTFLVSARAARHHTGGHARAAGSITIAPLGGAPFADGLGQTRFDFTGFAGRTASCAMPRGAQDLALARAEGTAA